MLLIQLYLNIQVSIIEQILIGIYFASTDTDSITLLYFNQNFFSFSSVLLQTFTNSSIYSDFFSEQIFNFTICSYLNEKNQIYSYNNSVTIVSIKINKYNQIQCKLILILC
ncbi:unnamed protein product [Paramecium primaurelia]|uniref:Uncharacterized protein n=1 Tax=Paramecium primaurelia TaxID=5886 RepID=A0A8S1QLM8_PARPR|nr:unnamed protein product [Paramecium primaurelia]